MIRFSSVYKVIYLTILLVLIQLAIVRGQNIKGRVVGVNGKELAYATVSLFKDTVELKKLSCDSLGNFELKLQTSNINGYKLKAFYLKNVSPLVNLTDPEHFVNLIINDNSTILKEINIVGNKPSLIRKPDRFLFIPGKALAEGSSSLDMMRHVPLIKYEESGEALSIIGKSGTVVYINNKKTTIPKEMLVQMLSSLPAENIKSIEIITNPSSEYAANTTGGIININIKRQLNDGWLGNLAFISQQSNYNKSFLNGSVNYRKNKLSINVIPSFSNDYSFHTDVNMLNYTDGREQKIDSRYFRRYTVLGGGLNVDYDLTKNDYISFNGWRSNVYGKSDQSSNTAFSMAGPPTSNTQQNTLIKSDDFYIYNFGNLNYHHALDTLGVSSLDFNIDYNQFFQRKKDDGNFTDLDYAGNVSRPTVRYKSNLPQDLFNMSEKVEYIRSLNKGMRLKAGAQFSNTHVNNDLHYYNYVDQNYIPDNTLSNDYYYSEKYLGGFVSLERTLNSKWSTNIGLRAERTSYSTEVRNLGIAKDSTYTNLFPSLSVGFTPDQQNQFGLSISRKINRPNIELLFPGRTYYNENYYAENNPFLQPVLIYNTELTYTSHGKYTFLLNYYNARNNYANFTVPVTENGISKLKSTYINYGHVNAFDLVIVVNQIFFDGFWETNFTPSFNLSYYKGANLSVPTNVTNHSLNIFLDNTLYISKTKKWTAFVTFKYTGASKDLSGETLNARSSLNLEVKKVVQKFSFYLILGDIYNGNSTVKTARLSNQLLTRNQIESNNYNRSVALKIRYNFGNNQLKTNKQRGIGNEEVKRRVGF
ncbi:TonB-dependent receptor [Pedobacter cryoconitis]|uniref:TonB-dependent receptor n=1 Tax=Pedobacter cryoconitis TaxID=188932 RepID=A0A127V7V5_9SPHI|nr:TonB-dependent receptor [Pedobacter cryoconitis]AMP97393.1 TonB-dependent receptor [Pedobacter cryoconitis]